MDDFETENRHFHSNERLTSEALVSCIRFCDSVQHENILYNCFFYTAFNHHILNNHIWILYYLIWIPYYLIWFRISFYILLQPNEITL